MKKNRMTYLDMAKGIGILLMIVGHTISLGWQKDLIYSFHMPLFFVCSGMTMTWSNHWLEWREAAKKSTKRLLLPALVLFMVMTLWTYLVEGQFDAAYTKDFALNRLASLLMASGSDVMVFGKEVAAIGLLWFLPALFFARLLLDALHLLMPKKWESLVILAWALVLTLRLSLPLALDLGLAGIGFVDIGIWLRERLPQWEQEGKKKIATGDKVLIGAGIFWFLAFLLQEKSAVPAFDMAKRDYGITFLGLAMAACGSLSLILLCRKLEKYVRADGFLATCGRYSMLLLSMHYLGYLPYLYYGSLFPMGVVRCLFRLVLEVCFSFFLILWKKKKEIQQEIQQEVWWSRLAFLAVFLLQMNYLLFCRFPGGLQYDSINQLTQVVTGQYSNHHPIYHTLWLTLGAKLAEILGGDLTLGVFFFTVMQVLVFSYMVSYLLKTLQQIGIRQRYLGIILGYFLVFPYHLFFAAYVNKDTLFTCCGVIFVVSFYRLSCAHFAGSKRADVCHMLIGGLGLALLRSNGLVAIGILFFIFLLGHKKDGESIRLAVMGCVVAISVVLVAGLRLFPEIGQGYESEKFSMPIQQIARVIAEEEHLSKEERQAVDALCPEVSHMTGQTFSQFIHDNYNPWRADEIKGQIQFWGRDAYLKKHKLAYLKLWLSLGLRYPNTYFEAWVRMTNGYWGWRGHSDYHHFVYKNDLGVKNVILLPKVNQAVNAYLLFMQENTIMKYFLHPSSAWWVCVVFLLMQLRKKQERGNLYVLSLTVVWTLFVAVPLNGEVRYVYILYGCLPFLAAILFDRTAE